MASRRRNAVNPTLFDPVERLAPIGDSDLGVPGYVLDVPESIPQLGYGSHQFFRYYGKFPSIVGREIINRFQPGPGAVLDCYAGSGTTLVEAQIAGCRSYGVDINPLAALACNVKTNYFELESIRTRAAVVAKDARASAAPWRPTKTGEAKLDKWFTTQAQDELGRLRAVIDKLPDDKYTEFVVVAFLGIVRRCSNAYDGEVRPHINPDKKPRTPIEAFEDKVADMIQGLVELDTMRPPNIHSRTVIDDNRSPTAYDFIEDDDIRLLVAHPPYLNSFNYLSVYSLEFYWAEDLDLVWRGASERGIRAAEHKAWPATDSNLVKNYYDDFTSTMKTAIDRIAQGGAVAVVVGDATIKGELEPVHRQMADSLIALGLAPIEVWYRTTHYGIGKYAYAHRADYHGEAVKKDAILFFQKVA